MLYMLRAVSPPIIRSSRTLHTASSTCKACLLLTASVVESERKPGTYQNAVCTVLELLMMGGENARNMYNIDNNKEYCIALHLVGCT
jgi:hypothetical protein